MIKNYIGNRKTIYTLTSGTEIVLTEDELKELLEENNFSIELKQEVEELKEELVSERAKKTFAENRVEELKDEIHDLKKDIAKKKIDDRLAELEKVILDYYLGKGFEIGVGDWTFKVEINSRFKYKSLIVLFSDGCGNYPEYTISTITTKEMWDKAFEHFSSK